MRTMENEIPENSELVIDESATKSKFTLKQNLAFVAVGLVGVLVAAMGFMGLGAIPKYNLNAMNLSGFLKGNVEQASQILNSSCESAAGLMSDIETKQEETKAAITNAYANYIGQTGTGSKELNELLVLWGAKFFADNFGLSETDLSAVPSLSTNLAIEALTACESESRVSAVFNVAEEINTSVYRVNNPGVWYSNNFYVSEQDPNFAWAFSFQTSNTCEASRGTCSDLEIVSNLVCSSAEVEIELSGGSKTENVIKTFAPTKGSTVRVAVDYPSEVFSASEVVRIECKGIM